MTHDELQAIIRGIAPVIQEQIRKQTKEAIAEVGTDALADVIVAAVKAEVKTQIAPVVKRVTAVEDRGYKGLHSPGVCYEKGDHVTFDGSLWIARDVTTETPGDGATKWQLAAKRGRDGRRS